MIDGINYRWTTGCAWRMLPHDFPPWATVYSYFRRWSVDGKLAALRAALLKRAPASRNPARTRSAKLSRDAGQDPPRLSSN